RCYRDWSSDVCSSDLDRDFAASATGADMAALTAGIAEHSSADLLVLYQQPLAWRDLPNPMALLPHQPSANDCPLLVMEPGAEPRSEERRVGKGGRAGE